MQLKIKDLTNLIISLKQSGMSLNEISELPIYIGNDDELNGIHCSWNCAFIDSNKKDEDTQYIVDMINEDYCNNKLNGKCILIS